MEKETVEIAVNGFEYLVDLAVDDGAFLATCPELPEITAAGMTREEALANIAEAVLLHDGAAAAVLKGTL